MSNPPLSFPKTVLLDMDGVIWRGYQPVIDIRALFDGIADNGATAYCITNNSTETIESYLDKLAKFNVILSEDQIISSGVAAVDYLQKDITPGASVFLIGEPGLHETVVKAGFKVIEDETSQADAVVVGLNFGIDYKKIAIAANLIMNGSLFIGTNPDPTFPMPDGQYPGAGTMIAAVQTASGTIPRIMGKPEPFLYQLALERAGVGPEQAIMIGDRLETDILGAQRLGIPAAVVLTGIVQRSDIASWDPQPDLIVDDALDVVEVLAG